MTTPGSRRGRAWCLSDSTGRSRSFGSAGREPAGPGRASPEAPELSAADAYQAIAAEYDALVRGDAWMRQALHAHYLRVFRPGMLVLDIACGTGLDAVALARRGIRVVAFDGAPGMIARAREKVAREHLEPLVEVDVRDLGEIGTLANRGPFDGAISAFAGLSTLPDLTRFAADAARLLRPNGRLLVHLLNRLSLWEWLGLVSRGERRAASRLGRQRERTFVIGGQPVRHALYFPREAYERFFGASFRLRGAYSLGSLRPPHTVRRIPAPIVGALERLDVRLGSLPPLLNLGRFFVLDLERR